MILKTVYHMNLLDFRNFLLKFVLRNLFSHRVKSLKNNSCLSSHDCDVHTFGKFFSHFLRQIYFPLEDLPSIAFYTVVIFYILSQGLLSCVYESVSSTQ